MPNLQTYPTSPIPQYRYTSSFGYKTLVSQFDSGAEQRRRLLRFPIRTFTLAYRYLIDANRDIIQQFFTNRGGMYESFWFLDFKLNHWVDEYVGRGMFEEVKGALANDGAVYTDETDEANDSTASDMTLLPAAPVVNDAYYIGYADTFDGICFNVSIGGVGTWTITWEYWDGTIWQSLAGIVDGTAGFTVSGSRNVTFTKPTDWKPKTIDSIIAYWVRGRVSAFTAITTQPKGTQAWISNKTYDLHSKTTSAGYKIYVNGVEKTGGGIDYTFISGGGDAGVDRIRFNDPPSLGYLITSDFEGYLRIEGRFADDVLQESIDMKSASLGLLYNINVNIQEVPVGAVYLPTDDALLLESGEYIAVE